MFFKPSIERETAPLEYLAEGSDGIAQEVLVEQLDPLFGRDPVACIENVAIDRFVLEGGNLFDRGIDIVTPSR